MKRKIFAFILSILMLVILNPSNTSELYYWRSYFDEPEDQRAIDYGISEWQLIF